MISLPLNIESIDTDDGRVYKISDEIIYPSITSILSHSTKEIIAKWQNRVGMEKAEKITRQAAKRGSIIHENVEYFLKNKTDPLNIKFPSDILYYGIKPYLERISDIILIESPLYSNNLKVAGRCDLIASYDNKPYIIDFKSSMSYKEDYQTEKYFLQTTAYSLMYEELTGVKIEEMLIMLVLTSGTVQIFKDERSKYIEKLKNIIENYYKDSPKLLELIRRSKGRTTGLCIN